jgi:hypothetical protein
MSATFDTDFRIKEAKERAAFPEYYPETVPAPATQRAIWNLDDTLRAIDEADLALERGCRMFERQCHLATMAGRTVAEAKADAHRRFRREYEAAVASERAGALIIRGATDDAMKALGLGVGA